ncbi:uncharacterized protein LOC128205849 isoform X2 [Mya arenaria]|uniref:uncharacterized protein LOC128205849 isoform X2 n=1 Tax=Mya arenaria TaxID=6604 RepID=UPI0022E179CD|nr:uncharacterized protein LOC128205849 isoform X2 [Mya arenaria]
MKFPYTQIDEEVGEAPSPPQSPRVEVERPRGRQPPADTRYDIRPPDDDDDDVDVIQDIGSVQQGPTGHGSSQISPPQSLLYHWPYCLGILEIMFGFLAAGFGALNVFLVPMLVSGNGSWSLGINNNYGACLWSGIVLILSGSLSVRISETKSRKNIIQFYVVSCVGCLLNTAFLQLMLICSLILDPSSLATYKEEHKYGAIEYVAELSSILGFIPLVVVTFSYFRPVCCGNVRLGHSLGVCWLPCCFSPNEKDTGDKLKD